MKVFEWLFSKKIENHKLTEKYLAWEQSVLATKSGIKKMGNRFIKESRTQLLIRFMREHMGISPFRGDNDFGKAKNFLVNNKVKL